MPSNNLEKFGGRSEETQCSAGALVRICPKPRSAATAKCRISDSLPRSFITLRENASRKNCPWRTGVRRKWLPGTKTEVPLCCYGRRYDQRHPVRRFFTNSYAWPLNIKFMASLLVFIPFLLLNQN